MLSDDERHIPVKLLYNGPVKLAGGGLAAAAENVRGAGRYGDDMVVHVNRREFEEMMQRWGEPTINPDTGLPEFFLGDLWDGAKDLWNDTKDWLVPVGAAAAGAFLPGIGQAVGNVLPGVGAFLGSAGTQALASGLLGAGAGYLTNGARGALLGGLAGIGGAYGGDLFRNGMDGSALGKLIEAGGGSLSSLTGAGAGAAGAAGAGGGMGTGAMSPALLMAALNLAGNAFGGQDDTSAAARDEYEEERRRNNQPLPVWENTRRRKTYDYSDVPDYTQEGERVYFENNSFAKGGQVDEGGGMFYDSSDGVSDGRADDIKALLSRDEYVIDAETVALLGNGSPEAGAKRLDRMRENIRKHKGSALAAGAISPDALPAEQYL